MPVSIGIPFFNPGPAFEKAVRSVFAQTCSEWELILVDDGSSDGSLELARAISDPRVRVVSDGRNRALSERLNQIASLAHYDLLFRMDADDVMHPDRVRRQTEWMAVNPSIDVLGARAITIDDAERVTGVLGLPFDSGGVERTALFRSLLVHVSVVGRRRWFLENPYDRAYVRAEDHELWLRAAGRTRYGFLPDPLVFVRQPDRLNLGSYVRSCRTDRTIFRRYGPALVGTTWTGVLLARSLAFEAIHRIAAALHVTAPLMRLRGSRVEPAAVAGYLSDMARAVAATVPGWPPPRMESAASAPPGPPQFG